MILTLFALIQVTSAKAAERVIEANLPGLDPGVWPLAVHSAYVKKKCGPHWTARAKMSQFPIYPADVTTLYRLQGQTVTSQLELRGQGFSWKELYTLLSRAQSAQQIFIESPITMAEATAPSWTMRSLAMVSILRHVQSSSSELVRQLNRMGTHPPPSQQMTT